MEVSGQHHAPASLPREITPVPTEFEAGWTSDSLWEVLEKTEYFDPASFRTSVRPVCS